MYCTEFLFDGISSRAYDLIICSFDGGQSGEMTAGSNIEFTTFKAPNTNKWVRTGAVYNEQLTFSFQICKYICGSSDIKPFSERELAFLMRWLVRKDYKWLQFIQEGYENIFYNCQINAQRYMSAGKCYGLTLTAVCDAPFGWSGLMTSTISCPGSKVVYIYDSSDEIGEVYPSVELYVKNANQNIQIENCLTGRNTIIRNCTAGEHIVMDNMKIESSERRPGGQNVYDGNHVTLLDDFNFQWFTLGNTFNNRENEIIVTGDCDILLNWRVPRKAVV
ncbi:MAG: hypothetical protein NC124_16760 [Clostridium sp.]|nr:hypothetical protein [Clostridium sp.]